MMMLGALVLPLLGSLAGKLATHFLGSATKSDTPPAASAATTKPEESFQAYLGEAAAAQAPLSPPTSPGARLAADDQASALSLGAVRAPATRPVGWARQLIAAYENTQAP
jgi:hypothetical protein